jgi:Carboxypeptidase regulatory-like domain
MRSLSLRCLLFSVFSTALILAATETANACSCGPRPTVLDSFEKSDEVVIVRAVSVEKVQDPQDQNYVDGVKSATMVVEKVFKGKLKVRDEIIFGQGGGADCIWTFDEKSVGHQFLFYLARPEKLSYVPSNEPGLWFAFGCGRSSELVGATEDMLYLENLSKVRGKTRISGSIGGGFDHPDIDVEGKKIKIIGPKKTYQTKTNKDGVFEIYDLPPGKYFIEPETPAGWKVDSRWLRYSQSVIGSEIGEPEMKSPKQFAVMLEPKKHASVDIVLTVDNSVRGRVLDPTGRAMYGVCVYLLRPGQDAWGPSDCTDEQGRFEITEVPEGEYVLVANQDGKPSSREPFLKIFYPNVMERERAAVINISAGDRVANLDIVIPKLEETVTISGVLRYSDGKPVAEKWVEFKVTTPNEKIDGDVNEQTDKAGRFNLRVLKGLTGELRAEDWLMKGLYKNCPKVDELVAKSGSNNVTVHSNVIKLTTEQDVYEVELTLPFPQCEKTKE